MAAHFGMSVKMFLKKVENFLREQDCAEGKYYKTIVKNRGEKVILEIFEALKKGFEFPRVH